MQSTTEPNDAISHLLRLLSPAYKFHELMIWGNVWLIEANYSRLYINDYYWNSKQIKPYQQRIQGGNFVYIQYISLADHYIGVW